VLAVSDLEAHVVVALREEAIGVFAGRDSAALERRCAGAAHEAGATTGARISVFMIAANGWVERGGCVALAARGAVRTGGLYRHLLTQAYPPGANVDHDVDVSAPQSHEGAHNSTRLERHERAAMGSIIGKITEELPRHEVLAKTASYEIRRYAPCVVAETGFQSTKGMFEGDQGNSFMRLAGFIGVMAKPKNEQAAPIAMTAPVLMNKASDEGSYKMAFFLPASRFARATDAPTPIDPNVSIKDVPSRTVAVATFSGNMRAALIAEKDRDLRAALAKDGVRPKAGAEVMAAGYNPPWTPWFLKTNEVLLEVEK
jgi:hypothetical protein